MTDPSPASPSLPPVPELPGFSFQLLARVAALPRRRTDIYSWHGHIPFARWLIQATRPRTLVELGVHKGDSYTAFCEAVTEFGTGTRCFGIDTWQGDEQAGHYGEEIHRELSQDHDPRYSGFSTLIRSRFEDALETFADGSLDLVHVDGLHTYEAVRQDFEQWLPKMSPRGVMLFHDSAVRANGFGVWRLVAELAGRYPHFEFHHSFGLTLVAVGAEPPAAIRGLTGLPPAAQDSVRLTFAALGDRIMEMTRHEIADAEFKRHRQQLLHGLEQRGRIGEAEQAAVIAGLRDELQAVYASSSWRLTAPLRWLGQRLKRLAA